MPPRLPLLSPAPSWVSRSLFPKPLPISSDLSRPSLPRHLACSLLPAASCSLQTSLISATFPSVLPPQWWRTPGSLSPLGTWQKWQVSAKIFLSVWWNRVCAAVPCRQWATGQDLERTGTCWPRVVLSPGHSCLHLC
uniref:Uncharacterized protein n=1 Tax=Myotis myotis TaxID=51298 RepID=A0A7J7WVS3_MYOMY|nr:hypothetical protein mMyoMyo1_011885 [Myotis myotis]